MFNKKALAMANPWDIPALPSLGEMSTEAIFTAVGRALSQWEYFEGYLGGGILLSNWFSLPNIASNALIWLRNCKFYQN